MASNALVQTRIDADVKEKATAVLETWVSRYPTPCGSC